MGNIEYWSASRPDPRSRPWPPSSVRVGLGTSGTVSWENPNHPRYQHPRNEKGE